MPLCFAESFSVSTQNLWHYTDSYDQRSDSIHRNLETEKADIMTFQEAWKSLSGKSLYKKIVSDQNLDIHYYKTNNTILIREGLAIASTFKQVGKKVGYKLPFSKKFFGKRVMIVSKVRINKELEVYVMNVHFSPFGDRKHERVAQLNFVIDKIKNNYNDLPIILTGDFNQDEDDEFFKPLYDLGFSASSKKEDIGCTFCDDNQFTDAPFNSKLDYIFYQKKFFKVINVRKTFLEDPISDHYGIRVEFSSF
jgi:endonuclease/exonuclease/phosphatase family metal-dependent hydrolase